MCSASQPSLLREPARQAQRHALLAEQRVAAVARADRPDGVLLGEVHDEAAIGTEIAERVQAAREVVGRCRGDRAPAAPMRVMIRMLRTTYLLSVISTPTFEKRDPGGPIRKGTTYIVRPFIDAGEERRQLARSRRPATSSCCSGRRRPCRRCRRRSGARCARRRAARCGGGSSRASSAGSARSARRWRGSP